MTQLIHPDKPLSLDCLFDSLRRFVLDSSANPSSFHDFELHLWRLLLALGHAATSAFLSAQGSGDLGDCLTLPNGKQARRLDGTHDRPLTCLFGTFTLARVCYASREGQKIDFVPLDDRLDLPKGKFSYLLQDFDNLLATQQPFGQAAAALEHIFGLLQHVDSLERSSQHMAESVEPFRDQQTPAPAAEEGPILVSTADAKGVVMRSAEAPPLHSHLHKRGPKTGRKKQAILGAVYTAKPVVRAAQDVVDSLFRQIDPQSRPKRPEICHKRVLALLNEYTDGQGQEHDGMAEVFDWMDEQLGQRNANKDKVIVRVMDGDERLWEETEDSKHDAIEVLDLLHVMERVWEVAGLLHERQSQECEEQVKGWLLKILRGQVKAVARDMRSKGASQSASKQKDIARASNYFMRNRKRMRYHEYLKAGYPIASGVIEGACRHYVKDRMERTGMSWKQKGAQAMLDLRAVALNGDWDEFQSFYRQRESAILHPHRSVLDDVVWPSAA
jgi:hypothetical protein